MNMTQQEQERLKIILKGIANDKIRYGNINSFDDMSKEMANICGYDSGRVNLANHILKQFFGE